MKNMIFLIGMPGTGKTFWGEKLSAAFDCDFTDLDQYIEQKEAKTVAQIFATYGEDHFRLLEQQALQELISNIGSKLHVVACGGGTPCYLDNLELMLQGGRVIYLRSGLDTLAANLCGDNLNFRPLLENEALYEKLYHLLEHRVPFYEQAHHIVDAENLSVATFGEIIHSCTKEH